MPVATTTALIAGLSLAAAGTAVSVGSAIKSSEAQKEEIAAQQRAESSREQGVKLDQQRKQREMVRQGILARSQALTSGSNQGAGYGSGIAGAMAGATEQTGYNVLGNNESGQISSSIFQANRDAFSAKSAEADAASVGVVGSGLSSLGGALMKNVGNIDRLGGAYNGFMRQQTLGNY